MEKQRLREKFKALDKLDEVVAAIDARADLKLWTEVEKNKVSGGGGDETRISSVSSTSSNTAGATSPSKINMLQIPDGDGGVAAALVLLDENNSSARRQAAHEFITEKEGVAGDGSFHTSSPTSSRTNMMSVADITLNLNLIFNDGKGEGGKYNVDVVLPISSPIVREKNGRSGQVVPSNFPPTLTSSSNLTLEMATEIVSKSVGKKKFSHHRVRTALCRALNVQRSKATEVKSQRQFEALSGILEAFFSGCCRGSKEDIANAKMGMMLAQTFFFTRVKEGGERGDGVGGLDRSKRIYVSKSLLHHSLWKDENFWDQALYQCVNEQIMSSRVIANIQGGGVPHLRDGGVSSTIRDYNGNSRMLGTDKVILNELDSIADNGFVVIRKDIGGGRENIQSLLQWHDLFPHQRRAAATHVHSIVFAQLMALAHSMNEFGCGIRRSQRFVRRLSVRYQVRR